ncbi:exonuclease SbcC [Desulfonispora thiosulfatigenes DSM 11270]|uniref:Nuclease SbcCD subunit C n=1 Tax=Desulfonispora thiosulfatigenes DSM 11270 TaxID=656914 RepID=A0A1W1ULB5_DESTI|nr:SMC family ATPase [Desulfonispora thiosulfatigenes]SMB81840.1 exonuclease SbcC [Desulfonispora thiosulfatigenes DSM 11270]
MRPLKLVMIAFGPYAGREEIDFRQIGEENVFLITGPTGAGKTTIFDGISYAIYGQASGDERSGESLRSQFACIDDLTSVELEFILRGTRYYIKRIPKQEKRKSRGEGTTEQKADAELTIYGKNGDKVYAGVNSVNEKVQEIMGINSDQFKQIMMIPQGDFRKLLTADSKDREKIFQKIFGTVGYKKVETKLIEKANEIKTLIAKLENSYHENLLRIDAGDNEKLKEQITNENKNKDSIITFLKEQLIYDKNQNEVFENDLKRIKIVLENKREKIFDATENNKKFAHKEKFATQKSNLELKKSLYIEKQTKIDNGRKALKIKASEDNYLEKDYSYQKKITEYKKSQQDALQAKAKLDLVSESLAREKAKEPEIKQSFLKLNTLKGYEEKVSTLDDKKDKLSVLQKLVQKLEQDKNTKILEITNFKKLHKQLALELEKARNADTEYLKNKMELESVSQAQDKLHKLLEANTKLAKLRQEFGIMHEKHKQTKVVYDHLKAKYEKNEENWFKAQAGVLAENLQEGINCPVCGSKHHPHPAELEENFYSGEKLKLEKEELEQKEKILKEMYEKLIDIKGSGDFQKSIVNSLIAEIEQLIPERISDLKDQELNKVVKKIFTDIDVKKGKLEKVKVELEKTKKLQESLAKSLVDTEKQLESAEEKERELSLEYLDVFKKYEAEKASLAETMKEIPENIRSIMALKLEYQRVEQGYNLMVKSLADKEKEHQQSNLELEKCKTQEFGYKKSLEEYAEILQEAKLKFLEEINLAGFDLEKYHLAKISEEEIRSLEKEIREYHENLKVVTNQYEILETELQGLKVEDINALELKYQEIKQEEKNILQKITYLFARIDKNTEILKSCLELTKKINSENAKYAIFGDLAEIARGNNSERLTFERYVLAAFFEEIIGVANLRLLKMTENRYELSRTDEKAKYNAQSGLELEVFDNYTGKSRHVKTLSGGEGFKTSLALALGLADVVQSYSGGISLDTIFIDEGFGTLDPESLEGAIETLLDLQKSGRMVGIISHVPEFKERIRAKLEVFPSPEGSKTKFKI